MTCEWWGDLWLQEGAARYFEALGVQYAQPDWDIEQGYIFDVINPSFRADETGGSSPVYRRTPDGEIETSQSIDSMFSTITYGKVGHIQWS